MRKSWGFFLILCVVSGGSSTGLALASQHPIQGPTDRLARAKLAEQALLSATFFTKGQGLHLSPMMWEAATPVRIGAPLLFDSLFKERWGFILKDKTHEPFGIQHLKFPSTKGERNQKVRVAAFGCASCHVGRAAGITIPGLGNKNIDPMQIGRDGVVLAQAFKLTTALWPKSSAHREMEDSAIKNFETLSDPKLSNLTQGMVPVGLIFSWFYKVQGLPLPDTLPRAQVKVPAFWGYLEKNTTGAFSTGMGDINEPGWGLLVDLVSGLSVQNAATRYKDIHSLEQKFGDLLPPKYPLVISAPKAERGRAVFEQNCAACHGTYERDREGYPIYKAPRFVDLEVVGTDPDRARGFDPGFAALVDKNPLSHMIRLSSLARGPQGYIAPRLHGIWSRFPYLHNGSVPNVWALLNPGQRPKKFSLENAGEKSRFDQNLLGLVVETTAARVERLGSGREVYDTSRVGHSNQGHVFGAELPAHLKLELIEYLKTL